MPKEITVLAKAGQIVTVRGEDSSIKVKSATKTSTGVRAIVTMTGTYVEITPPPVDSKPIINSISAVPTSDGANITIVVSEKTQEQIFHGLTTAYGKSVPKETSFNYSTHTETIVGYNPGDTVHFQVHVWDTAGQETISTDQTFKVLGTPTTPPPTGTSKIVGFGIRTTGGGL